MRQAEDTALNQSPLGHRLVIAFAIAPDTHYSQWKALNINIVSDHGLRPQSVCGRKPGQDSPYKTRTPFLGRLPSGYQPLVVLSSVLDAVDPLGLGLLSVVLAHRPGKKFKTLRRFVRS
ncbi:hypothetical protein CBM2634_U340006 [Cupriavidus taiwanensis]|uniref:Uncharacterized protein n=1 Tax=Cupriavidus taiwanensis TaxID=164546 RepID=A0A375JCH6_9BURK|nr:hypothetical protein CBM2634_U340006 [Cupriavidus taiwanensis]